MLNKKYNIFMLFSVLAPMVINSAEIAEHRQEHRALEDHNFAEIPSPKIRNNIMKNVSDRIASLPPYYDSPTSSFLLESEALLRLNESVIKELSQFTETDGVTVREPLLNLDRQHKEVIMKQIDNIIKKLNTFYNTYMASYKNFYKSSDVYKLIPYTIIHANEIKKILKNYHNEELRPIEEENIPWFEGYIEEYTIPE